MTPVRLAGPLALSASENYVLAGAYVEGVFLVAPTIGLVLFG
jgi:hypothetical protein